MKYLLVLSVLVLSTFTLMPDVHPRRGQRCGYAGPVMERPANCQFGLPSRGNGRGPVVVGPCSKQNRRRGGNNGRKWGMKMRRRNRYDRSNKSDKSSKSNRSSKYYRSRKPCKKRRSNKSDKSSKSNRSKRSNKYSRKNHNKNMRRDRDDDGPCNRPAVLPYPMPRPTPILMIGSQESED